MQGFFQHFKNKWSHSINISSRQTLINWLVLINDMCCVLCEVRTEFSLTQTFWTSAFSRMMTTTTTMLCKFVIQCVPGQTVSFFVYRKQLLQFECMQCLQCGFAILIQMKQKTEATRAIQLLAICKYTHNKTDRLFWNVLYYVHAWWMCSTMQRCWILRHIFMPPARSLF